MCQPRIQLLILLVQVLVHSSDQATQWFNRKLHHEPAVVSHDEYTYLSGLSNEVLFNQSLSKIAIPRIMGTRGHEAVKNYILDSMKALKWDIKMDIFSQDTVVGHIKFENIVATLDPAAQRHLVLACHYDSKLDREKALVLATDSAVPCSMMINLAQLLDPLLQQLKTQGKDLTLQFVFFDGEEAFLDWTNTDSIYGARHLAHVLSTTSYPERNTQNTTHLHRMDVMVLLDLLGSKNPTFRNFFSDTSKLYSKMQEIETKLNEKGLIKTSSKPYFTNQPAWQGVEDDHLPFLHRGVRILHIIPTPFPPVWHTESDTVDNLDFQTIDNLNKIFRVFVSSYLHLNSSAF